MSTSSYSFNIISIPINFSLRRLISWAIPGSIVFNSALGHTKALWCESGSNKNTFDHIEWSPLLKIVNKKDEYVSITGIRGRWGWLSRFIALSNNQTSIAEYPPNDLLCETPLVQHFPVQLRPNEVKYIRCDLKMFFYTNSFFRRYRATSFSYKPETRVQDSMDTIDRVYKNVSIVITTSNGDSTKIKL